MTDLAHSFDDCTNPSEERTLLLVHGFSGSSDDFTPVVDLLTPHRRIARVDQPGHGESPRRDDYSLAGSAAELATFIAGTFDGPIDVLGHSMGGRVVIEMAINHPELVSSLILMDTWAAPFETGMADIVKPIFELPDADIISAFEEFAANAAETPETPLTKAASGEEWIVTHDEYNVAHFDPKARVDFGRELFTDGAPSMLAGAAGLTMPTTIVVGELDVTFRGPSDMMLATIPDAELVVFEGAYHLPQLSHPGPWSEAIIAHLARS